jgi:hypothetical protein
VDRDLDGSGRGDHARGQLAVGDGDEALFRTGGGAGPEEVTRLVAQAGDGVGLGGELVAREWADTDMTGAQDFGQHAERIADVEQQRPQVPPFAGRGLRQELGGGQRGGG